ncbi:flagellar basal body-associated protein FliL [Azospirillum lipoferum]|uniref:Flagellar basal body-associated FliL family protein n=1 Tax=Azospirillum lipoferum TaxID=193 RepID=A0A5A9GTP1_AZOLI|nr:MULTISPECIES: hypothetical protein [Azospirillum]KAA0597195.1 hypothetical protein FZ942_08845 [Azospirillum lipoferum]MCP1608699.1 flagellar basal body-associated protein FliL [Azospirillum lipoferum]MDW5535983.1 hypothetical protein [Azospirillum sp. NL1]
MVKALIVLVLGIVLLGGASFGGWFVYQKYFVPHPEEPKKVEPPPKPPTAFVRLPPLVVPMIGPSRVEQFVTVVVAVEVHLEKQPIVQANQPRLTDAFLTALYGGIADQSILSGALVNIPAVKTKLVEAAAKVVGKDAVYDVLVQAVTQRNL